MTKIEVFNSETGEITQVDAGSTLGQIIGVSNMTEEEMSEAIAADIKGLSPAKVSEVLKMIIDTENPFFNAIDAIRNGDTKRFRLVIEEVGADHNALKSSDKNAAAEATPQPEPTPEMAPPMPEPEVEDAETVEEEIEEADDDQEYLMLYEQAKVLFAANDLVNATELKKKFSIDTKTASRMWLDLESDSDFADQREEEQAKAEDGVEAEGESVKEEAEAPNPEYADDPSEAAKVRGQKAFLRGDGPDDNPFDGGTDEAIDWKKNYDHAQKSMKVLFDEGAAAANDGKALADCPYEVDGVKFKGWKKGFDSVEQVEAPKTTDSHADGKQAALNGGAIEDNPHAAGMTKHRIWNEGFAKGQAELASD